LAERFGVTAPTMTDTLKRMIKQGFVMVDQRKEIFLTEKGKEAAESLVRRHRLSERWLTDVLGLDWSQAHQEACKLEHALSSEVADKLSDVLHNPTTCPHGNPIPGSGQPAVEGTVSLDQVTNGDHVTVIRISQNAEEDPRFLEYLQRNGIVPQAELSVQEVAPWAGTITLSSQKDVVSVGLQAAANIWVLVKR
jgi:DtxR family Mn-dependent transcriptional regulator